MQSDRPPIQRRLAAILAADVVGFSSLMGKDEEGTHRQIKTLEREVFRPTVEQHHGRVVKTTGDGFLVEFGSPIEAVRAALSIQKKLAGGALRLRIGINLGDVIIEQDGDVYGEGVNVAARLEALCDPGGILASGKVFDEVEGKVEVAFESRGEQQVKNIAKAVRVYAVAEPGGPPRSNPQSLPLPDKPSIAVLPFTNLSGDPEQEYFADGIVDDIITALSQMRWFFVIARNSSFTYKAKALDVLQIARELGVRYLLQGAVRKVGNRVRISGQLLEGETARTLWADHFDGELTDIFALQDAVTRNIAAVMQPNIYLAEAGRAQKLDVRSLDAWGYVSRALPHVWRLTRPDFETARGLLESALERDPSSAKANALLSWCLRRAFPLLTLEEGAALRPASDHYARTAVALDPEEPWSQLAFGAALISQKRFEEALTPLELSLRLNPYFPVAHLNRAIALVFLERTAEAAAAVETASRVSPRDPFVTTEAIRLRVQMAFVTADYLDAERIARAALAERPDVPGGLRFLCASLSMQGREDEAREVLDRIRSADPRFSLKLIRATSPLAGNALERYIEAYCRLGLPE